VKLKVNGKETETSAVTIMALWQEETADLELESNKGYAISLNGKVVRKAQWDTTPVSENDQVEIVRAMQGG
jgi:sulfur carrier protein